MLLVIEAARAEAEKEKLLAETERLRSLAPGS